MLCRPRPSHAKPRICRHFCQWFFRFISNFISTVKFHSVRQFQSFCNFSSRCNNNTWFFLSGFYMIRTEVCRASCMRPCTAVSTRSKGGLSYDEICFRMEAGAFQRRSRCPAGSTLLLCARRNSCNIVKVYFAFKQTVGYTGGKNSSPCSAFNYQTCHKDLR